MPRWLWFLSDLLSRLWVRASLFGVVAVGAAIMSMTAGGLIPDDISRKIGADAVDGILNILASSMLAVTTFSLSTMVAAYAAATAHATPRATNLLIADPASQNAISTFLGAFVFSIVSIILLKAGLYGESGRLILFAVTIGVIVAIIVTLLRWVEYLSRLGRVNETISRIEDAAAQAMEERLAMPCLGGEQLEGAVPQGRDVYAQDAGYVQHIDMSALAEIVKAQGVRVYVRAVPGTLADAATPLATVTGGDGIDISVPVRQAFITGRERSFKQDPRYGFAVLHEIAIRALSPAINDPGTAIHVLSVGVRLFSRWPVCRKEGNKEEGRHKGVYVPSLRLEDALEDFFPPIARDGAGFAEVMIRMQKALHALSCAGNTRLAKAARMHADLSCGRGMAAMTFGPDKERLRRVYEELWGATPQTAAA